MWPAYRPRAPGTRPPILFDPKTGKLAYPLLLRQDVDLVKSSPLLQTPLVVRTNAGEDCLDVTFRSELTENADEPFSNYKVSAHIHFMQLDVSGQRRPGHGLQLRADGAAIRAEGEMIASATAPGVQLSASIHANA